MRHFLMLKACGMNPPKEIALRCEELLASIPMALKTKTIGDVENWLVMASSGRAALTHLNSGDLR